MKRQTYTHGRNLQLWYEDLFIEYVAAYDSPKSSVTFLKLAKNSCTQTLTPSRSRPKISNNQERLFYKKINILLTIAWRDQVIVLTKTSWSYSDLFGARLNYWLSDVGQKLELHVMQEKIGYRLLKENCETSLSMPISCEEEWTAINDITIFSDCT